MLTFENKNDIVILNKGDKPETAEGCCHYLHFDGQLEEKELAIRFEVPIQRVADYEDLPLPQYMSTGASGMDLYAAIKSTVRLKPKDRALIPCGIKIALPKGFEAQIRPRSRLAVQYGIGSINSPGTIDSDYRGEIKALLYNFSPNEYVIHRGDRIAQMVIAEVARVVLIEQDKLDDTQRGSGGFGHTGV